MTASDGVFAAMAGAASPEQRGISFGGHVITIVHDRPCFGTVIPVEEHQQHGTSIGFTADEAEWSIEGMEPWAVVVGRWYSVDFPEGIVFPAWRTHCWPLDAHTYDWAKECNWSPMAFPEDLWSILRGLMTQIALAWGSRDKR